MSAALAFSIACSHCGGELDLVAQSEHSRNERVAALECGSCGWRWLLRLQLAPAPTPRSVARGRDRALVNA